MHVFNSKCHVIGNCTSGWRKFPIQQLDWLQVTKEIQKRSMICFVFWKACVKTLSHKFNKHRSRSIFYPIWLFLFTCCFAFWKQKVFKISFLDQCLSNAVIYNSEKEETFFLQNEMPGEHFILGIMMECCRYFYGAMMPDCNFQSQWQQNKDKVTVC